VVEAFLSEIAASEVRCYFARRRCSERLAGSEANCQCWRRSIPWSELGACPSDASARLMSVVAPTWYVQILPLSEVLATERGVMRAR
jgi:hypothetical protein